MFNIYATFDARNCMSEELFPLNGNIPRNEERFRAYTMYQKENGFIVAESIFQTHLKNKLIENYPLILISESLYQKLDVPAPVILGSTTKKYIEHENYMICINYQDAVSVARKFFHETTILGDGPLLKQAITSFNVDRVYTVSVPCQLPGTIIFPDPLQTTYFDEITPPEPWESKYGKTELRIFYRKPR